MLIAGGLSATALAAAVLFSDDFDDGDDAGWVHLNLLDPLGGTNYDASTGSYAISTNFPLPPLPLLVGDGASVADSIDNPDYRNCVMRATVHFNNSVTNALLFGRAGATPGEDFYAFALNNVEDVIFISRVGAGDDVTDLVSTGFELTEEVDYKVEARMSGERLSLKVWAASDSEPKHPQLVTVDTAFQQQTGAGVAIFNEIGVGGQLTATFDNVSYTRGQSQ